MRSHLRSSRTRPPPLGIGCREMQFKAVLSSACSCPGPEQDSENPPHFPGESSALLPQTSSSSGHFRDALALGTARRACPWPGKLRTTPLIFQPRTPASHLSQCSQLLPNQQNQLCLHLRQVGAHGPRGVQQDAHSLLQNGAKQSAAPCARGWGRGREGVRLAPPGCLSFLWLPNS